MQSAVRGRLVRAAQAGEFVHYAELAKMLGIDMDNPHWAVQVGRVGAIPPTDFHLAKNIYRRASGLIHDGNANASLALWIVLGTIQFCELVPESEND